MAKEWSRLPSNSALLLYILNRGPATRQLDKMLHSVEKGQSKEDNTSVVRVQEGK